MLTNQTTVMNDVRYQGLGNINGRVSAIEPKISEFTKSLPSHIRPCISRNQLNLAGFDDVWDDGPPWADWSDMFSNQ